MERSSLPNREATQTFDVVTCIGPRDLGLAFQSIRSIAYFASPRRFYLIVPERFINRFRQLESEGLELNVLDENTICPQATLNKLRQYFETRNAPKSRAGWYLQQFAKLYACRLEGISEHYLIFDSDTVLLRPVKFFDPTGRVYIASGSEFHQPYFDLMEKVLGYGRVVDFSFITEHLMVDTAIMEELIKTLEKHFEHRRSWIFGLLDLIEDANLSKSGFSEYEFYGNFLAHNHPGIYVERKLSRWRRAAGRYGHRPTGFALRIMAKQHELASFEAWQPASRKLPLYNILAFFESLRIGPWFKETKEAIPLKTYLKIAA